MSKLGVFSISFIALNTNAIISAILGEMSLDYAHISPFLFKGILTIPPFFVLVTSFFFPKLSSVISTKPLALLGVFFYTLGGYGISFVDNIYIILIFRALSGIGMGILMPITTGLISYLFPLEKTRMLGLSSGMNQFGCVVGMVLASYLGVVVWQKAYSVYLMGVVIAFMVVLYLPDIILNTKKNSITGTIIKKVFPYAVGMYGTMGLLFVIPTHFSIFITYEKLFPKEYIGLVLGIQPFFSFLAGMSFQKAKICLGNNLKYFAVGTYIISFLILSVASTVYSFIFVMITIGYGFGLLLPLMNTEASKIVTEEELVPAMTIMSFSLFFSQFSSPLIFQFLQKLFHISSTRFPFYGAFILSIFFFCSLFFETTVPDTRPKRVA